MDFKEIEDLKQEDIMGLYDDIMEFGDDTRLAGCCCAYTGALGYYYRAGCISWCRGQGSSCAGWGYSHYIHDYCFFGC